jgi:hypothetical protein
VTASRGAGLLTASRTNATRPTKSADQTTTHSHDAWVEVAPPSSCKPTQYGPGGHADHWSGSEYEPPVGWQDPFAAATVAQTANKAKNPQIDHSAIRQPRLGAEGWMVAVA